MPNIDLVLPWARELMDILQSPLYLWAVLALIAVPGLTMTYGPRLLHAWSAGRHDLLESATGHSTARCMLWIVVQFVLVSSAQAVIGAVVLMLLRNVGVTLV